MNDNNVYENLKNRIRVLQEERPDLIGDPVMLAVLSKFITQFVAACNAIALTKNKDPLETVIKASEAITILLKMNLEFLLEITKQEEDEIAN